MTGDGLAGAGRDAMVAELSAHVLHGDDPERLYFAWDARPAGSDLSGRTQSTPDAADFDELWEAYAEAHVANLLDDAQGGFLESCDDRLPSLFAGALRFEFDGRDQGWLELRSLDGEEIAFGSEGPQALLAAMPADRLARLHAAVRAFDAGPPPRRVMAEQMATARARLERAWADPEEARLVAERLGMYGWEPPSEAAEEP